MREYLFRGKRVDNGEWAEGYLGYNKVRKQYYIMDDVDSFPIPVHKESVGQYIGMKDKNCRKIFEGDICRIKIHHENKSLDKYELAKVIFEDGYFEIVTQYGDIFHHYWLTLEYVEKPEVIGTVFENADLLEG